MSTKRAFTGGPLDGEVDGPMLSGQVSRYLRADRSPLPARTGDRIEAASLRGVRHLGGFGASKGRPQIRSCYRLAKVTFDPRTGEKIRTYKWIDMDKAT